jgi:HAD superfamily hydrolase (TIGR01484 family)
MSFIRIVEDPKGGTVRSGRRAVGAILPGFEEIPSASDSTESTKESTNGVGGRSERGLLGSVFWGIGERVNLKLKLISTDFDGTLHDDLAEPPVPSALQALIGRLQGSGTKWIINTGRDLSALTACLEQAQLRVQPDYLVVVEREIYRRNNGAFEECQPWNRLCRQAHLDLFDRIGPRVPEINAWIRSRFQAMVFSDTYSPFCLVAASNADADAIMEYLETICRETPNLMVMRNDIYARFNHADYHKGSALAEIGRLEGVGPDAIFAAGDHLNDLPMLSSVYARYLMAPANAVGRVKLEVQRQQGYVSREPHGLGVLEALQFFLGDDV